MTMKSKKQIQNQSQSGRSMVEMLGVLAIIAVLSIGGIVGFRLAMNHYQASQIAHEMNMMRTDAQIKIAQGTENLTLGAPYDEHKINFNGYKTNFDCALANEEEVILNDVSCYAANAYYIELQEIPEDVCQPLARLINGMDNLIDFYVNEPDAEGVGKDTCDEGNNTLTAIFGADSDSDAVKCGDAEGPECPENLPVCLNHMCVECETNAQCTAKGKDPHCHKATHTCEPCPDGSRSEGNACVLSIDTIPFFYTPDLGSYVTTCQKLTPHHFGPYTHSYELWVKGTFDDEVRFYVNEELPNISTTEPTYEGCDSISFKNFVNCAGYGLNSCSSYLSDYHLGRLNAGDFGNLAIRNENAWMAWGGTARYQKLTNDAAAWLVLKEEEE